MNTPLPPQPPDSTSNQIHPEQTKFKINKSYTILITTLITISIIIISIYSQIKQTPTDPLNNSNPNSTPKQYCQQNSGTWLPNHQECEWTQSTYNQHQQSCLLQGGIYNSCNSPCRHASDPSNAVCPAVCVTTCTF